LLSKLGDQSNLILDPDLDSYYTMSLAVLRFPELLERLLIYAPVKSDTDKTQYLIEKGRLEALRDAIKSDYSAAYAGNPSQTLPHETDASRIALLKALSELVLADPGDSNRIPVLRAAAIASTHEAWKATATSLDSLLRARVDLLFHRMWLHLGMAASLLSIILFLVFFVARLIALPLRRLAEVANRVQESSDYSLRAEWRSRDEIGQLVSAFNTMLERLNSERLIQQELAAQARAAEAQRELLEAIPIPLLVTTVPDHHILHANAPAEAWVDTEQENPWATGLERGVRARLFQRLADEDTAHEFEVRWNGPQGISWALISANRLQYQGKDAVLTTFSPINAIKRLEARLQLWATIFEATSEGIMVLDRNNTILLANAAMARTTGYRLDELVGREPSFLHAERSEVDYERAFFQNVSVHGAWQGEYWLKKKNGEESPHWLVINTVRDERGELSNTIALFVDIAERKAQEEKIRHLAHHDALTGLPNRLLFNERLKMSLQQADRHVKRVALLFIDLDRFKFINDSLGHHVGDGLLQSIAQRLGEAVRAGDTVSRQGGDEFVVILNSVEDAQEVAHIIERRMVPLILQTHTVCDIALHISCSVGIAIYPDDADSGEILMRNADTAMYAAKSKGRNNFQFFSESMNKAATERLNIEAHLQHALEKREFELHVQPIVDAATGELQSVEALLRWRAPCLGLIPPDRFIPIAEENGKIHEIGQWVLTEACRLHMHWLATNLGVIPIAVNVSVEQFRSGDFVEIVASALVESGMSPSSLHLELTESLMMTESENTLKELQRLKSLGVMLSLDDFGTGYSSLNYLHRFPIDKLKIDRSFVSDIIEDPADLEITRAIIGLGRALNLRVVAEGVEHSEELKILRIAGCDEVQGYLFSRPIQAIAFENWLVNWRTTCCIEQFPPLPDI
jgi:diguanylate cyclase (GGDEF)-like protein/PAS domain S-box-containing protein